VGLVLATGVELKAATTGIEITVLYDNYTLHEACQTDWGFSCKITGTEKHILFDAGTYANILLGNIDKLQVGTQDVGLAVISHDHLDHTGGLAAFLGRRTGIPVYLPKYVSSGLIQSVEAQGAAVSIPDEPLQICEHVHLTGPMSGAATEQSMVLETPKGLAVITGCAHPGVVQITRRAKDMLGREVYFVMGGFHLINMSDSQIQGVIGQLRELGVQKVGPSHCTGDRAIELFRQAYRDDFVPIGVGRISIPQYGDFNGDWKVDIDDLLILIEHWGQAEPSLDIAPGLFGDGQVGRDDLEILMSHWGQEIVDPTLLAHWKLDETEGDTAYDETAGAHDGTVVGDPSWEPVGGQRGGALRLDGIEDYVATGVVLSPADGPFSVFAWIKGGAAGQVILSQFGGHDWLLTDSTGALMTDLKGSGRKAVSLYSQTVITDGQWHRVGLTWDDQRTLYVDDVSVAEDEPALPPDTSEGFHIGAGANLEPGSFFSGLIDDVRIYNRAVKP
jgi:7,8-dihydropterin-6-yl-methyl-4-(beta-D-ribofuranosyl)aminobenzene 5'-phosphate synthase